MKHYVNQQVGKKYWLEANKFKSKKINGKYSRKIIKLTIKIKKSWYQNQQS